MVATARRRCAGAFLCLQPRPEANYDGYAMSSMWKTQYGVQVRQLRRNAVQLVGLYRVVR